MRDIVLIAVICACAVRAIGNPVFGMLAFVCVSFLNPQSFTWGIGTTFPVALLTAGGTLIGYAIWSEPKKLPFRRESILLLAFWVMFGISTIFALYPDRAFFRLEEISKILLMVVFRDIKGFSRNHLGHDRAIIDPFLCEHGNNLLGDDLLFR